jgi:membrane associated rhomboid family serine protease
MFFLLPIRVEAGRVKPPLACLLIAAGCVVGFWWTRTFPEATQEISLNPANGVLQLGWLTSLFLHFDWFHLLGNLLILYLVGPLIEDVWGPWRFSALYFTGGLIAGVSEFLLHLHTSINIGGASGAIAAIMGAFVIRFGARSMTVAYVAWVLRFIAGKFEMPAFVLGALWFLVQVQGVVFDPDGGVAFGAHLGGFACGLAAALMMKARGSDQALRSTDEVDCEQHERRRRLPDALSAIDREDFAAARTSLEAIAPDEPDHPVAELLLGELDIRTGRGATRWEAAIRQRLGAGDLASWVCRVWSTSRGPEALSPALALELAASLGGRARLDENVVPLLRHASEDDGAVGARADLELAELAHDWRIPAAVGERALEALLARRKVPPDVAQRAKVLARKPIAKQDDRNVLRAVLRSVRPDSLELVTGMQVRDVRFERIASASGTRVTVGRRELFLVDLKVRRDDPADPPLTLRLTSDDAVMASTFPAASAEEACQALIGRVTRQG